MKLFKPVATTQPDLFATAALAGGPTTREIAPGVVVVHHPGWIEPSVARELFDRMVWCTTWKADKIGGPSGAMLPRLTAWYGDPGASYRYSGIDNDPTPWTPALDALRVKVGDAVSTVIGETWKPNAALLNLYRTGMDSVGFHADNEAALGHDPARVVVASISLGTSRRFVVRQRPVGGRYVFSLGDGDLCIMGPGVQSICDHAVLKEPEVTGVRISITFRHVIGRG